MDDDSLDMPNWGYYEASFKGNLGLQLMTSMVERDVKPFIQGRNPPPVMVSANKGYHHPRDCVVQDAHVPMSSYTRESWISQRDKYLKMVPAIPNNYGGIAETSVAHHPLQMLQSTPPDVMEEPIVDKEGGTSKKRQQNGGAPKAPKVKKPRKQKDNNNNINPAIPRVKPAKKSFEVIINGLPFDISGISIPICSCTGTPQQCYRWGCGGWQSACCTTNVSMHPLPMSTKRRGARIAGRKMSQGAFKKVLEKLAAEGYNFANPIDLRIYWARHGTNKFVTIR